MRSLPRYESYKESGVEWLGEIPAEWEVTKLGTVFEERREKVSDTDYPPLSVTKTGIVPQLDSAAKSNDGDNRKGVRKGDFVINSRSDRKGSSGIAQEDGSVSLINIVLTPKRIDSRFCEHLLKSNGFIEEFYRYGHGIVSDLWTTRYWEMKSIQIPVPPMSTQTRIAAFLDEKTAEIDEAIAKKQRLLDLLAEQKAILINRAVTKGINPNIPMKESGVEWIGEIPSHWEVSRSKWLFSPRKERARPDDIQLSATQAYGVISQQAYMEREGRRVTQITQHLDKRAHVEIDDFVISMRSFEGGLERAWESGCIRSSYVVLQPSPLVNADFFTYLFKSHSYIQALRATANFIRDGQDLNFNNFSLVDLPVIPYEEQQAIADHLNQATKLIEDSIRLTQHEIALQMEFRTILISNAVTGKIKV